MALVIALVIIGALAVWPQMWVQSVIKRHSGNRPDLPETGAEFARSLLHRLGLANVKVEETPLGDHYDPEAKAVRLMPQHYNGRSLAAVVIAAHEIGHAMQDATAYPPLAARTRLAKQTQRIQAIGMGVLIVAPILIVLMKAPHLLILELLAGFVLMAMTVAMHVMTLPVELDASFRRALPVLETAKLIPQRDMRGARQLLRAAAFTYVAAAAIDLINVFRWIRMIRF